MVLYNGQGYYYGLIGSHTCAFDSYQNHITSLDHTDVMFFQYIGNKSLPVMQCITWNTAGGQSDAQDSEF